MKLAIFQMNSVDRSVDENLAIIDQACAEAKAGGGDLIIFPEMAVTGYNIGADRIRQLAQPRDGSMVQALQDIAKRNSIGVLCGFPELDGSRVFNSAALVDASGSILSICRKAHLFGDVDRAAFSAGDTLCPLVQFGEWTVGLAICYDVEFPELVRAYAVAGADALLVPTANMLPYVGVATRVVPSRAEENEIYVAYANRVGGEGAFEYCGLSCVTGPDGIDLARAAGGEEMIFADLSKDNLIRVRKSLSHINDRRTDLYS
ncbi:Predicted amidohydrolase [Octadecabacter temperatus]|uniref:(R)-stereoselective amidase n=1 Tax=Octadecabacter temperatus TaxID=1458307 RepID=A0A0K0Y5A6_9RHOB|nr:carbon-nitrogen hydrolase family protein [Octadecabacter temperatus]AKS46130.1 (R)-stereoselective amidase [Octadecabacter temperatus]SIO08084.1 Predicted amidohydrolase [Octadecabacter temperatus]